MATVSASRAGTHLSACEVAERWVPAFAGTPVWDHAIFAAATASRARSFPPPYQGMRRGAAFGETIEEHIEFIAENVGDAGDRLVQNDARQNAAWQDVVFRDGAAHGQPASLQPHSHNRVQMKLIHLT